MGTPAAWAEEEFGDTALAVDPVGERVRRTAARILASGVSRPGDVESCLPLLRQRRHPCRGDLGQSYRLDPTAHADRARGVGGARYDDLGLDDLFLVERPAGVDLLVRAAQDRKTEGPEGYLWSAMETAPVVATVTLELQARGEQVAREATVTVSWRTVTLLPPNSRAKDRLLQVNVWAIWTVERTPPAGAKPVEWLLLTTMPITTTDEALERLSWYTLRWGIEVWHKILKSGCQIEKIQLETAARLIRCLTLYSVIAWRIFYATMLARAVPDAPCTVLLDDAEWQGLYCRIHRVARVPTTPRLWHRPSAGLPSWGASKAAPVMATRGSRSCGMGFNAS